MRNSLLLSSAALFLLAVPAMAAPADNTDTPETVVVTATRTAQPIDKTGTSISVISGDTLKEQQTVFLTDALAELPGVTVARTGGAGQTTSVYLRGADAGQTTTLIDGIRINDPSDTSSAAIYGDLQAVNIDRVEVLRGSQSTLYGSNAIGGVINIMTKRGGENELNGGVEYGSDTSYRVSAAANGTYGKTEFGVAASDYDTRGTSAAEHRDGNNERDGNHNWDVNLNTRTHITDTTSVDIRGYFSYARSEYDDGYDASYNLSDSDAYSTHDLYAGYAGVNQDLFGGKFHNRLAIIATSSIRNYYDSASYDLHRNYYYSGHAFRIEYQGVVDIDADTQLSFGANSEQNGYDNSSFYSATYVDSANGHKRTTEGYGQIQHTFLNQVTVSGGVRVTSDEEFGTHTSYKFTADWKIPGTGADIHANFGSGYKSPSLYQLYSEYSNPISDLKPETSKSWEVGATKNWLDGKLTTSATYFERRTKNLVDFQSCYSASDADGCAYRLDTYGYYTNINRAMARGVELSAAAQLTTSLKLTGNYTWLHAYDRDTHYDLARRPRNAGNVSLHWQINQKAEVGVTGNILGTRYSSSSEYYKLGTKPTVDVFTSYSFDNHWQIYARVNNLTNDRTQTVHGYGAPGMSGAIGIRARL